MTDRSPGGTPAPRRSSIASRVIAVTVVSAAAGGLLAALAAIMTVDRLLAAQADQRLRAALYTLADELDEERTLRDRRRELHRTLQDENAEIRPSGIRLSVFEGPRRIAGRSAGPPPPAGECTNAGPPAARVRSCTRRYKGWQLLAQQQTDRTALWWRYVLAAMVSVVLGGVSGAVASGRLTRWALGPLFRVASGLRDLRPGEPGAADLGPPSEYDEVRAVQAAVEDLTRQVEMLLGQARGFAANAAHELRTPLTTLRAELELLAERIVADDDRRSIERACLRVTHLATLVDRLLVLALPADKLSEGFEAVSIADVVQDALSARTPEEQVRVRVTAADEGMVRGDGPLLTSLVANAIDNALKYSDGTPVAVQVGHPSGAEVVLEVRDQGPGMSVQEQARAFEPFYRVLGHAPRSGHGLGLALIAHVARVHGGEATLSSGPAGTTLTVRLPEWQPG